mmetsp:Transcript_5934/g.14084  ORF Transcript_5934/g.14084 Transcript_5934/m.14084 type:complete len:82 (-) Transcript_5934:173-418(-)
MFNGKKRNALNGKVLNRKKRNALYGKKGTALNGNIGNGKKWNAYGKKGNLNALNLCNRNLNALCDALNRNALNWNELKGKL